MRVAESLSAMCWADRPHISSKRVLCATIVLSSSTTRIPSAVDSSVDCSTETVSESAPLRGFFALGSDLGFLGAVVRRVAMGPQSTGAGSRDQPHGSGCLSHLAFGPFPQ